MAACFTGCGNTDDPSTTTTTKGNGGPSVKTTSHSRSREDEAQVHAAARSALRSAEGAAQAPLPHDPDPDLQRHGRSVRRADSTRRREQEGGGRGSWRRWRRRQLSKHQRPVSQWQLSPQLTLASILHRLLSLALPCPVSRERERGRETKGEQRENQLTRATASFPHSRQHTHTAQPMMTMLATDRILMRVVMVMMLKSNEGDYQYTLAGAAVATENDTDRETRQACEKSLRETRRLSLSRCSPPTLLSLSLSRKSQLRMLSVDTFPLLSSRAALSLLHYLYQPPSPPD